MNILNNFFCLVGHDPVYNFFNNTNAQLTVTAGRLCKKGDSVLVPATPELQQV